MRVASCIAFLAVALVSPVTDLEPLAPETERLVTLANVWSAVKFGHPYLLYRDIDWDGALVAAIPRVRDAKTNDDFEAAIGTMLEALGDPATRVAPARVDREEPTGADVPLTRWHSPETLIINAGAYADAKGYYDLWRALRGVNAEIAKARHVILDFRSKSEPDLGWAVAELTGLSASTIHAPSRRSVIHSGYRPQYGNTSGGYSTGFLSTPGDTMVAAAKPPDRIAFIVNAENSFPPLALALRASGRALIVSDAPLTDASLATVKRVKLGQREALIRVDELETGIVNADAVVTPVEGRDALFEKALELLQRNVRPVGAAESVPLSPPRWRPDSSYADMDYPAVEYRLLAAFRLWSVIDRFYPYKHLIGDWDAVLPEFIPRFIAAANAEEYLESVLEMAARVEDSHTYVAGKAVTDFFGAGRLPIEVRAIEGEPVVTWIAPAVRDKAIRVGDVVVSVDGERFTDRLARFRRLLTGSTDIGRANRAIRAALWGATGSTGALELRGADARVRRVELVRLATSPPANREGAVVRVLEEGIGYVDLARLTVAEVDAMFDELKETRAIVFDMRGYPNGTAWAIAPRLNTRNAKFGASFRRRLVNGADDEEIEESGFFFDQPLPESDKPKYHGKTVMLIDERTISQAEHTGLFFEAANGTEFIGTNSAGANGDITELVLPGGLRVGFTGHDVRHADGRQLQRIGLEPNVRVAPTIRGLREGRDEVLERAIESLRMK